jgi:predicted transposase YbfD/YdcC
VPAVAVSPVPPLSETLDHWQVAGDVGTVGSGLMEVLASVPDPRDRRGRRYPLAALLAIAILAVAAGMRGYAGFATWARTAPPELMARLGIERVGCPSEKTFRRVLSGLDAADLDRRLGAYFTGLAITAAEPDSGLVAVSLDGKTLKGARKAGSVASHLVSIFAHRTRLVLGQLAVTEKSNEIPCLRMLLRKFPRIRLMVVVDAMHTQVATAKLICRTLKSHYVMVAKSNQPGVLARIKALPWTQVPVAATDDDRGHGRIERRSFQIVAAPKGIGFPYAKQVVRVTRERHIISSGKSSTETVYAVVSLPFEQARPADIATWLRSHWGIENSVHYVRDVTYDEDRSTVAAGTGPQVMASIRIL